MLLMFAQAELPKNLTIPELKPENESPFSFDY